MKASSLQLRMGQKKIREDPCGHVYFAHINVKAEISSPEQD